MKGKKDGRRTEGKKKEKKGEGKRERQIYGNGHIVGEE